MKPAPLVAVSAVLALFLVAPANAEQIQTWRLTTYGSGTLTSGTFAPDGPRTVDLLLDLDALATISPLVGQISYADAIKSVTVNSQTVEPTYQSIWTLPMASEAIQAGFNGGAFADKLIGITISARQAIRTAPGSLLETLQDLSSKASSGGVQVDFSFDLPNYTPYEWSRGTTLNMQVESFAPVPEPGTLVLMALGLGGIFTIARRKEKHS